MKHTELKKLIKEEIRNAISGEDRYTDKEMLQRTTAGEFPEYFTILDIIERYKEYVVGHLRSEGELNEQDSESLTEDKGDELANKVIMRFRKALRNLNDDEVYSFREKIAMAIDAKLK